MNNYFISVIFLFALGIAMVWKPKLLWKIENIFCVKNGEPTEFYIALMRIGGAFFIVCAVFTIAITIGR